jgi:hypothetical protein
LSVDGLHYVPYKENGEVTMTPDELIEKWLEPDPNRPRPGDYRVKEYGTHVWALIGLLSGNDWDVEETARDYEMPVEAVEAAVAFYHKYPAAINVRIEDHRWDVA